MSRKASEYAKFIGSYLRKMDLKGQPRSIRIGAFREAVAAWHARRYSNPFIEPMIAGIGSGAGFGAGMFAVQNALGRKNNPATGKYVIYYSGSDYNYHIIPYISQDQLWKLLDDGYHSLRVVKAKNEHEAWGKAETSPLYRVRGYKPYWERNPSVGELVSLKRGGEFAGSSGKIVGVESGGLLGMRKKYRLLLPGGEQVLVPASAIKSLNPMQMPVNMQVPFAYRKIGHADISGLYNPMEIPFSGRHIAGTRNPRMKYATCPVHGNIIPLRKGWKTVTCPVGGETLGIKRR